jgi:hemerythrin-like domain-containing protein
MTTERREFLVTGAALGLSGLAAAAATALGAEAETKKPVPGQRESPVPDEDVSPPEDLMREHGVLKRILLIYSECRRRLHAKQDVPPQALAEAAGIIRTFIEDYHEKLEEDYLFPRFKKAHKLEDLCDVLLAQHQAGRKLTDITLRLATAQALKNDADRQKLAESLHLFVRMYSPHEAREDTVLFPAFRHIVSAREFDALGDDFEKREHELFGSDGFEKMVDRVAGIERALGIYDLAQFTPQL